MNTILDFGSID